MASSGFDVDTDQLKSAAPTFSRESVSLEHAATKLNHALAGLGQPWGDDEQGKKFEHVYTPHLHAIEKATHALTKGLQSIHDTLKDMADNHEEADRSSASGFDGHGGAK
ncbi:WXG100 family type VII secretion target [Streptomyces sioyaensis]|uniref:WXG100 family type VII secretion target n=1 Tax=Streptomyces sioyaensis TaxID=67364 RepID=UPI003D759B06